MATPVTILGAGAWGTAVATLLAHNGASVRLWCYEQDVAASINHHHCNHKYLPDVILGDSITATTDFNEALAGAPLIFEAIPVPYLRSVLEKIKCEVSPEVYQGQWVVLSKGLEHQSLKLPSAILEDVMSPNIHVAVMSGPNFAAELASHALTATVIASNHASLIRQLSNLLSASYFKPIASTDPVGAQVGGALKNVMTLILGIAHEAPFSHKNTTAYLFAQGLEEIARVAEYYGGRPETIYGLAGLGDMVLSCTGTMSRNMQFGLLLGQGLTCEQATKRFHVQPEGVATLQSLHRFIKTTGLNLPLCHVTYQAVFEGLPFKQALAALWRL
ncbi:MAG: NAD(P)H-dependent glycerol-3-phosphate dehydrogenase [Candidatus Babeliales bacterium]|jgi:glycerol-3-phosphate dehydrogenase (NAD(P)+)